MRRWDAPDPFVHIGQSADAITRKLATEADLRLVERAETCTNAGYFDDEVAAAQAAMQRVNYAPKAEPAAEDRSAA